MNSARAFELMEELRAEGWCVVLKCLPKKLGWIIEGSRSEYDAPAQDITVGRNKWLCEAQWMGDGRCKGRPFALDDTPEGAIQKIYTLCQEF